MRVKDGALLADGADLMQKQGKTDIEFELLTMSDVLRVCK